jgi:hypothetical protein
MDFECYVGKYEIRRFDELPEKNRQRERAPAGRPPPTMPYLVQVGPATLVKPKLNHLRAAVGHLLQTPQAKWDDAPSDNADERSALEKNVLLISRHIGMLRRGGPEAVTDLGEIRCESLDEWAFAARWIQMAFAVRGQKMDDHPEAIGELKVFLVNSGRGVSMQIRPSNTHDALMYVAAMEIARGTTVQACDNCGKPFLEGGERDLRNKKRAGSRFCSDKCRYEYHNEERRKAARKRKL